MRISGWSSDVCSSDLALKDQVTAELMPRAFAKRRSTRAWIDPVSGWIVVDAASPSRAEELLEVLRDEVDGLSLELPELAQSPATAMTAWLAGGDAPGTFELEIGRAACRERVCQYVVITGVGGSLKKKKKEE